MRSLKTYITNDLYKEVPMLEMAFERKKFIENIQDIGYNFQIHTILSIAGWMLKNDAYQHWMGELLDGMVGYVSMMKLKQSDNYNTRYKAIYNALIDTHDIEDRDKFEKMVEIANSKERKEAEKRSTERNYPINIKSSDKLFKMYMDVIKWLIDKMANKQTITTNEFENFLTSI